MKANSWNFPCIGARLLLVSCALIAVPCFAATTVSPTSHSHDPEINYSPVEYETVRMLTASANGPMQVVAEDETTNEGKQIATSLPVTATPPIDMTVKNEVRRPDFIPTSAFTNEEMIAPYHDTESGAVSAAYTQELPKRIKLNPAVVRHWAGAKVEPCWVNTVPDLEHPGTFSFSSETEDGPKGWLQLTGERSAWGHPEYRYWLDPS
ncbi:MAG: hypothetical protein JST89_18660 [Cyanobacteria bacterium SZAS-4]|nr:hypothetical protein [Cyanobacteria bacterium SZAS-4]